MVVDEMELVVLTVEVEVRQDQIEVLCSYMLSILQVLEQ